MKNLNNLKSNNNMKNNTQNALKFSNIMKLIAASVILMIIVVITPRIAPTKIIHSGKKYHTSNSNLRVPIILGLLLVITIIILISHRLKDSNLPLKDPSLKADTNNNFLDKLSAFKPYIVKGLSYIALIAFIAYKISIIPVIISMINPPISHAIWCANSRNPYVKQCVQAQSNSQLGDPETEAVYSLYGSYCRSNKIYDPYSYRRSNKDSTDTEIVQFLKDAESSLSSKSYLLPQKDLSNSKETKDLNKT